MLYIGYLVENVMLLQMRQSCSPRASLAAAPASPGNWLAISVPAIT